MMKLLLSLILFALPLSAVLPPVWQGVAEIRAIVNAKELDQYLDSGEILESIEKDDDGWVIVTNRSEVHVEVVKNPQAQPGPEKFTLKFSKRHFSKFALLEKISNF